MLRVVVLAAIAAAAVVVGSSAAWAAAPVFPTSDNAPVQNESATVTLLAVGEGQTRVGPPVRAVDADGDALTYSLSDWTTGHASFFTIDSSNGQISLQSNTRRGVYRVRVSASDGTDTATVDVTIHVTSGSLQGTGAWAKARSLTAGDGSSNDDFGFSLDATADVIVVGAPQADYDMAVNAGAVYVFNANTGAQLAKLTTPGTRFDINPSVRRHQGYFGASVAVAGDWIFVGAARERIATRGLANRGNVYVFKKPGSGWTSTSTPTATLTAGPSTQVRFGESVAVSDDGNTLAVGMPWVSGSRGEVKVFTKPSGGWANANSNSGVTLHAGSRRASGANLGTAVAISGDGSTIAASAPFGTVDQVLDRGVVFVFAKPATGWAATTGSTVVPRLSVATASRRQGLGNLGLALSSDGSTLAAGAAVPWRKGQSDDSSIPADAYGSAYVYVRPSTGWADATETAELGSFGHKYDYFGRGMAISGSGDMVAVGNSWSRSSNYRGSVYVYSKPATGWVNDLDGAGANLKVLTLGDADSNTNHRYAFGGRGLAFIGENKLVAGQSGRVEALVQKDGLSTLPSGGLYGANADHSTAANIRKGSAHLFTFTPDTNPVFPTSDNDPVQNESATVTLLAVGEGQTKVGPPVRAVDVDGDALTYSLSDWTTGHAGFFTIDSSNGQISRKPNALKGVYRVRVSASDGTRTDTVDVTIHVTSPGQYPWEDSWAQARPLTAGDGSSDDDFGGSLDATDEVIVVGARYLGSNNAGAAYVFDANSGAQLAKLTSPNAAANGNFGTSVAVAGDTIFVSAPFENSNRGRVYVFTKPNLGWVDSSTATATLTPAAAHSGQVLFGASVAVSDDGNTLAVGMSGHSSESGAVLVFPKTGAAWSSADSDDTGVVMLHAGTRVANGTYFGNAVAVSGDGSTIAAASPYVSTRRGAVYVFTKTATTWAATSGTDVVPQLTVDGAFRDQQLGIWGSLGLSSDGSTLVAGAPVEWRKGHSADSEIPADAYGSAYVYVRPSEGWADATETAELGSFGHKYDYFGRGVAISGSGDTVAVGNPWSRSSNYRGSVYVYSKPSGGWVDDLDGAGANLRVLTLEDADSVPKHRYALGGRGLAFIGDTKLVAGQSYVVEALKQKDGLSAVPSGGLYGDNVDHSVAADLLSGSAHLFTLRQVPSAPQQQPPPPPPPPPPPADGPDDETTTAPTEFTDVSEDSPHAESIEKVAALGITSGTGAGTFSPSESVTRAQMATFVARTWEAATGRECPSSGAASFGDVDSGSTHAAGIDCVSALGVAAGTTATAFSPTAPVTRAQMATFLARAWAAAGRKCSAAAAGAFFDDVPADSTHAAGIGCMAALGITRGTGAGTFAPSDAVTRAQMATFLARFHEALTTLTPTGS